MSRRLFLICSLIFFLSFLSFIYGMDLTSDVFSKEFLGYNINTEYKDILKIINANKSVKKITNDKILYAPDTNSVKNKTKVILCNFIDNKFIDCLAEIEKSDIDVKNEFEKYLNLFLDNYASHEKISDDYYCFWNDQFTRLELIEKKIDPENTLILFHYYFTGQQKPLNSSLNCILDNSSFDFYNETNDKITEYSVGFSYIPLFFLEASSFNSSDFSAFGSEIDLGTGIGFVVSGAKVYKRSSVGFTFALNYSNSPSIFSFLYGSGIIYNITTARFLVKIKAGRYEKNLKLLIEPGIISNFVLPLYLDEPFLSKFFFYIGPVCDLGFEYHKKNYSFEFCGIFGFGNLGVRTDFNNYDILSVPFFAGVELRWNFYTTKAVKIL